MFLAKKIRLIPTKEQEILFWKSAGTARWAYNYFLAENQRVYDEEKRYLSGNELRKYINNTLKKTTHTWLSEVSANVMKHGVMDAEKALQNYFKRMGNKPKFKNKHKSTPSFYVNYESLVAKNGGFHGERIGYVKTSEPLPKINDKHYVNPRITYDGKYWYLSISYKVEPMKQQLTDEVIGIDLGIKDLAICSNGKKYQNINKTQTVKSLKKKLKREQKKLSRMIECKIVNYKSCGKKRYPIYSCNLQECKNIQKQRRKIKLIYRRLTNIRDNYIHQTTTEIVKTKPSQIVMETLNIRGMMKNRYLSQAISEQKFYEFKKQIAYKSQLYGIQFVEVPMFYPSSKTCSICGNIKQDLKLSDRVYKCSQCGSVVDRDINAAINLSNYVNRHKNSTNY
jgi:putative transposase